MAQADLSRRRFIRIAAAVTGIGWFGDAARAAEHPVVTWRGTALGATAEMRICHPDRGVAAQLIERSVREVQRLERIFSLYRPDSALSALNRAGVLVAPPRELVELLQASDTYHRLTSGAFDPTVQPLWLLYADHFTREPASAGPPANATEATLAKVGWQQLQVSADRIAFQRRGMALTLNGVAQGFATDRIVDLLREAGIDRSFVDLGEMRALGTQPDGSPWQIGIADPQAPERARRHIPVVGQAVATSGAYGYRFDAAGRFHHLIDPRSGASPARYLSVTAVMPTATAADAFSTAFNLMPPEAIADVLHRLGTGRAIVTTSDGTDIELPA